MRQMRAGKGLMAKQPGIVFVKLLGTGGKGGYSLWPDFSVFALFCVWNEESDAERFFVESAYFQELKKHSIKQLTIFMHAVSSRGRWTGQSPFLIYEPDKSIPYYCILTRATLKNSYLREFWKRAPAVSRSQRGIPGLLFSKGVGEVPFYEQATFTIWNNLEAMKEFAYTNPYHVDAIKKTREVNGFKEEMFTRFQPYRITGTWSFSILEELVKDF